MLSKLLQAQNCSCSSLIPFFFFFFFFIGCVGFFVCLVFVFLGLHPWHMEVLRLGVKLEL